MGVKDHHPSKGNGVVKIALHNHNCKHVFVSEQTIVLFDLDIFITTTTQTRLSNEIALYIYSYNHYYYLRPNCTFDMDIR